MFLLTVFWSTVVCSTEPAGFSICAVIADQSETTKQIVGKLQNKLPVVQVVQYPNLDCTKKQTHVYLAVGPAALRSLLAQGKDGAILSIFTSSQAYRSILESFPKHRHNVTAIFAEPSPADQLQLISLLYKRRINVAVLLSEKNQYLLPLLKASASQSNIDLSIEPVTSEDDINRTLNKVTNASVILATPDKEIYNAENIRTILTTTYNHDQVVIGFSAAFVKAGALASTYSSIEEMTEQIAEMLNTFAVTGRLSDPQFPKYFSVVINDSVARSLNLIVDDRVRKFQRKPGTK